HLRQILSSYAAYYNEVRTHLALGKDAPLGRAVQRTGVVVAIPIRTCRSAQRRISNIRGRSAYPSRLSLIADIRVRQPSANRRPEQMQQSVCRSQTYSITSSARPSTEAGSSRPSAPRGLQIDHQLVLRRRLHRQIGGFLPFEDAIHVTSGEAV